MDTPLIYVLSKAVKAQQIINEKKGAPSNLSTDLLSLLKKYCEETVDKIAYDEELNISYNFSDPQEEMALKEVDLILDFGYRQDLENSQWVDRLEIDKVDNNLVDSIINRVNQIGTVFKLSPTQEDSVTLLIDALLTEILLHNVNNMFHSGFKINKEYPLPYTWEKSTGRKPAVDYALFHQNEKLPWSVIDAKISTTLQKADTQILTYMILSSHKLGGTISGATSSFETWNFFVLHYRPDNEILKDGFLKWTSGVDVIKRKGLKLSYDWATNQLSNSVQSRIQIKQLVLVLEQLVFSELVDTDVNHFLLCDPK